jgi:pimeloyl-ACP methyl ester carboxylesterase
MAHGAVNGMWGDRLRERYPGLAVSMCLRAHGRDVPLTAEAVRATYPTATARLAVFVHGWCDNAESWQRYAFQRAASHERTTIDYGAALQADLGCTPLYVRYNSGLHISDNGRALSDLLDEVSGVWPVPIEQIALIGHSMGGLVSRSACHAGALVERPWTRQVRHVVCLGSPHLGAPLEKGVNALTWAMARVPETRAAARLLNLRSAGVKDLRFGACVDADWRDADPDEFLRDRCTEVEFLPDAAYYFVGATLSRSATAPVGRLLGDVLVQYPSASGAGRRRRLPFEAGNGAHLGGMHHLQLLNSPQVYAQLRRWLDAPVPRTA